MKAKTVSLDAHNKVKKSLSEKTKELGEMTVKAGQNKKEADEILAIYDKVYTECKKLENELAESKKAAEVFKNKYQALNQAVKAMANANDNLLFKC